MDEDEPLRRYRRAQTTVPAGTAIAVLVIGDEQSWVIVGDAPDPRARHGLALGSRKIAREFLRQAPPSALELENAIFAIEEQIAQARAWVAEGSKLFSLDPVVQRIALVSHARAAAPLALGIDEVERSFHRLASVALGRPAAHEAMPVDAEFVAALLILREFLHHLQFSSITVLA